MSMSKTRVDVAHFVEFSFAPPVFEFESDLMHGFFGELNNKIPRNKYDLSYNHYFHSNLMQMSMRFSRGQYDYSTDSDKFADFIRFMMYPKDYQGALMGIWECKHSIVLGRTDTSGGGVPLFLGTHTDTFRIKSVDPNIELSRDAYPINVYIGVEELDMFFRLIFSGMAQLYESKTREKLATCKFDDVTCEIIKVLGFVRSELESVDWYKKQSIPQILHPYRISKWLADRFEALVEKHIRPLFEDLNEEKCISVNDAVQLVNDMREYINSLRAKQRA